MWIIDFGVDMPEAEAALYEAPFEYVRDARPARARRRIAAPRTRALVAPRRGHARRCARRSPASPRYIATPDTAKHRLFVWLDAAVLPDQPAHRRSRATTTTPSASSTRASTSCGRVARARSSARSSPASATRPRPASRPSRSRTPPPEQRERVGEAARRLVELRDGWLNPPGLDPADLAKRTLTNLYNQRPTWLANAHADLDAAVFAAYGWPADLADAEILERLLALNLERADNCGSSPTR